MLLLGEEDEDEEGAGRRRRTRGRVAEKPRGGAEEEDDDEEEDEEVVVEVVDGDEDDEDAEERFVPLGPGRALPKGPARGAVKVGSFKREMTFTFQSEDFRRDSSKKLSHHLFPLAMEEDVRTVDTKKASRILDQEKETRSICLLEQKRKVVSSNIDVPPARKSSEELDMDKVTAAMVLTSLSTSPLVRSPPVRTNEGLSGSWKEGAASSSSSSGYWSWSAPSDQSNPSTPSPPLSADSFKPFRSPAPPDDGIDEVDASSLLFDEPIPRKRKNSMKVMFKCLWKNCGKVLNTAAGIQKHIRAVHLGRAGESGCSDGEEDFYYTEVKLNTDAVAEVAPVSPSQSLASPPAFPIPDSSRTETPCAKTDAKLGTPLSRSAPTTLYLVHTDHAYQATPPVTIPGSAKFTPNGSSFSISWQSPPVTFTGVPYCDCRCLQPGTEKPLFAQNLMAFLWSWGDDDDERNAVIRSSPTPPLSEVSPTHHHAAGSGEQRQHVHTALSSPPRGTVTIRKPRGEGKKCRKVYGMENRDMWCTACRWKKACQRFID
ncbi:Zinc finger protein 704 [Apodemus speciosus]|uniref:Zinc finger protein 704 n=1 Tax=Apodemus speciosus TaxID=105296 RepID=A0ABQ0EJT5_APOSI